MPEMLNTQQDQRPVPDPTLLTTDQLRREIGQLEKTVNLEFAALAASAQGDKLLTAERFVAVNKALDAAFTAQTTAMQAAFVASEKAVAAALASSEKRIESARQANDMVITREVDLTSSKLATQAAEVSSLREMLNERYQTQTKALDAAFVAQQAAVATSFDASEKAMAAALLAAKEAVDKAAVSTEKRFDTVNEQLTQLNGSLAQLLPRNEAEARMRALDDRLTDIKSTIDKGFTGTDTRSALGNQYVGYLVGVLGLVLTAVVVVVNVVIR